MSKPDLRSLEYHQVADFLAKNSQPGYRADQLFSWLQEKRTDSFDDMLNLPLSLRQWLKDNSHISTMTLKTSQTSAVDGTVKYLFQLEDGNSIETVQMQYKHGSSLCVSTQVGCKMGCSFCASTKNGLVRNLTSGEILSQVYMAEKISGKNISSIVLMGIGEPLDNFDAVVSFLKIISDSRGKGLSLRSITLSTCGLADKMRALADLHLPITLSVSLHAPTDKARESIMPINKKWNIKEVLNASRYYFKETGRRISFEYALIAGVNDNKTEALALAALLNGMPCHINLIPVNPIATGEYTRSSRQAVKSFADILIKKGFNTTIRRELGSDISAACGQLRHENSLL